MWRKAAYDDAVKFPFLMHGMLAFSALHLSATDKSRKQAYAQLCRHHLVLGVPDFRHALSQLDRHSEGPCLAMSLLLASVAFASISDNAPSDIDGTTPPITLETIITLFIMIRGTMGISQPEPESPYAVNVRGLGTVDYAANPLPARIAIRYEALKDQVRNLDTDCGLLNVDNHCETSDTYATIALRNANDEAALLFAVCRLEETHQEVVSFQNQQEVLKYEGGVEGGDEFDHYLLARWVGQVSDHFITLLRTRHRAALVVLARFIDLVELVEHHWTLENWSCNARKALERAFNVH